jgi:hypothetical protein
VAEYELVVMYTPIASKKGQELIKLYEHMVREGYERTDQTKVENAFSDFELRAYRPHIRSIFDEYAISSVLDYGCGGSDWRSKGFDDATGQSAMEYFKLNYAYRYEPARKLDERQPIDCVISFDVLEHIFIADVPSVLRDMFSYANKLIVINVACYPAAATLPNGENAHITVRHPLWWKGMIDSVAVEYPNVVIYLICSTGWRNSQAFPQWSGKKWLESKTFVINE